MTVKELKEKLSTFPDDGVIDFGFLDKKYMTLENAEFWFFDIISDKEDFDIISDKEDYDYGKLIFAIKER